MIRGNSICKGHRVMRSLSLQYLFNPLPPFTPAAIALVQVLIWGTQTRSEGFPRPVSTPSPLSTSLSWLFFQILDLITSFLCANFLTSPFLAKKKFKIAMIPCTDCHSPVQSHILLTLPHPFSFLLYFIKDCYDPLNNFCDPHLKTAVFHQLIPMITWCKRGCYYYLHYTGTENVLSKIKRASTPGRCVSSESGSTFLPCPGRGLHLTSEIPSIDSQTQRWRNHNDLYHC